MRVPEVHFSPHRWSTVLVQLGSCSPDQLTDPGPVSSSAVTPSLRPQGPGHPRPEPRRRQPGPVSS
ncbi:hypothetical protein ACFPM0_24560 [Pseudonocardia sulfidoxydans]|uniref:hypothetical protein n=1 Tax=Pseudonocardia sulfidoxydans TaxID=54011 RepID=UPI00360B4820